VTRAFLGHDNAFADSPLWRADVQAMVAGAPLSSMSGPFRTAVARLAFIPVVERCMEAKHKDVKHALASLTRHTAVRVSIAIRSRQLRAVLKDLQQ